MNNVTLIAIAGLIVALAGCQRAESQDAPQAVFPVRVVAERAKRQPVSERLALVGTLLPNESVEIKSEMEGMIESVHFEEGQRVNKGDLLAQLDESKIRAALAQAQANFKLSTATLERSQQLYEKQMISHQEYDQAASAAAVDDAALHLRKRELRDAQLLAPFDGVAGVRVISPGQVIERNTVLTRVVAIDPVKVEFNIPERYLRQLNIGQQVAIQLAAYPGERFEGSVYFIAPELDPQMRTVAVRARIPNVDGRLRPGMFASLDLTLNVRDEAVVVPETALIPQGDKIIVFIVDEDGNAQIRPVRTGFRMNGLVEITEGLEGGEGVIIEGYQKTIPGGPVMVSNETAQAE
jgi:membrane fusion protein, multidrug efflux system